MVFAGEGAFELEVCKGDTDDTELMAASQFDVNFLLFVAAGTLGSLLVLLKLLRCVYFDTAHLLF